MDRFSELKAEYDELRSVRAEIAAEIKRNYPNGFTGNGVPGDFEGLEMDWNDADRDLRLFLESEDGKEFLSLRSVAA